MTRRRRRVGTVLGGTTLLAVGVAAVAPLAANALAPTKAAWFNAASGGGVALPFPTTAADDLHVGEGATGATAYAAVAYDLAGAEVHSASLTFKITPNSTIGTIDLVACPTKNDRWKAGGNQPLDQAPDYDCTSPAAGLLSSDATSVSFALDEPTTPNGYSVAIVPTPGSAPFQADLTKPDAMSLMPDEAQSSGSDVPVTPADSGSTGTSDSSGTSGTAPLAAGSVAAPPALDSGTAAAPSPELAGPAVAPAAPGTAAQTPQTAAAPTTPVAVRAPLAPVGSRERYVAGSLLALLAGFGVWAFQQPGAEPRLLGGMARHAGPAAAPAQPAPQVVRGIGRFSTPRTGPARRLV